LQKPNKPFHATCETHAREWRRWAQEIENNVHG
jgi:hypothetical protein